jgi:hypothetical protein
MVNIFILNFSEYIYMCGGARTSVCSLSLRRWWTVLQVLLGGPEQINKNFGHYNMAHVMAGDLAVLHAIGRTDGGLEPPACPV